MAGEKASVVISGTMFEPVSTIPYGSKVAIGKSLEMDWFPLGN